ncbi:MAG: erythromycin esterase family protein [Gammaproteobacteria bacterium]|nr:erythromycin esterase family protein [Gammaproteobacteria bacterium]
MQVTTQAGQTDATLPGLIFESSEPFADIETANLDGLLARIGDSRLVLLGEASHGTAEFYDMRARITRELVEKKGFNIIAAEADWPDASVIDHFIRRPGKPSVIHAKPFGGFPSWMWANHSTLNFMRWLKDYNRQFGSPELAVGFYGLDLYNLYGSIESVLEYLQDVDQEMAQAAVWHYSCLMPWANDPSSYSDYMQDRRHPGCKYEVHSVWQDLIRRQGLYRRLDEERYFNAIQNAQLIITGERYYRIKHLGIDNTWNLRDQSMFDTLLAVLNYRGPKSKAVVWAHNSHLGDARATDMSAAGEINLGQRVRETFGDSAYLVGFGTDHGTVAAAKEWGGPMEIMPVPPAHKDSYEYLFHKVKADNFLLPLRSPKQEIVRKKLLKGRLQRGIGTTYGPRPESEMKYHYSYASLPRQFDEYIWFDETQAVKPLGRQTVKGVPDLLK